MATIGYYIDCDDAYCPDCWPEVSGGQAPYAEITSGAEGEADAPTHCRRCELLIPHRLTSDGLEYVREAYREVAAGRGGRRAIVRAWVEQYLTGSAQAMVVDWPKVDRWSPPLAHKRQEELEDNGESWNSVAKHLQRQHGVRPESMNGVPYSLLDQTHKLIHDTLRGAAVPAHRRRIR